MLWWRPTTENKRFGLEQIAEDEDSALEREHQRDIIGDEDDDGYGRQPIGEGIPMEDLTKPRHNPNDQYQILPDEVFVLDDEDGNVR